MESEYYEITTDGYCFILHKSCKFDGKNFSNAKFTQKIHGISSKLEKRCELVDKITENINLPINYTFSANVIHNGCYIYLSIYSTGITFHMGGTYKDFNNYEKLYEFISQNEPNLIINHDIKIALKD